MSDRTRQSPTEQRRRNGWLLLVAAVILAIAALGMWKSETSSAKTYAGAYNADAALIDGGRSREPDPNHTPAIVMFVAAGALGVLGLGLVVTNPYEPDQHPTE